MHDILGNPPVILFDFFIDLKKAAGSRFYFGGQSFFGKSHYKITARVRLFLIVENW